MVRLANDPPLEPTVLLNALRRPGDEVQLTQAIGELAKADAHFAEGLLHLLIDRAPNGQAAAARLMPGAPVRCELERPMRAPDQTSRGRIELKLTQGPVTLFVEVKLHSDYSEAQLDGYLQAIAPAEGEFLMAVTRNISRYTEPPVGQPGWLGSVRWAQLADQLKDLPGPGPLREQWNLFLEVLKMHGDLGSRTFDEALVAAFEQWQAAWTHLSDFLEQVGAETLDLLRNELGVGRDETRSLAGFGSARARRETVRSDRDEDYPEVISGEDELYLAFTIPARDAQRLWIGFGIGEDDDGVFYIATGWPESPTRSWIDNWQKASQELKRTMQGRRFTTRPAEFVCRASYPLREFVGAQDVPERLLEHIQRDLPLFVRSGLFSTELEPRAPQTSLEP